MRQLDAALFQWVRWFWGLTCDFWAVFEEFFLGGEGKEGIPQGLKPLFFVLAIEAQG
jgi:hypothetical protein